MAGKTTATTMTAEDAKTLEAKQRGDAWYVEFKNWVKSFFSGDDATTPPPPNPLLSDVNPVYKPYAEKLIAYHDKLKSYSEKYGADLSQEKREALAQQETLFNNAMKLFSKKNPSAEEIGVVKKGFDTKYFPQMEMLAKEYDALVAQSPAAEADAADIDPATNKPRTKGLNWKNLLGGGLTAVLGYFLGSMFGAGPFGTIASVMLAVGGFFIANQNGFGDKIAGFFGLGGGADKSAPGQAIQQAVNMPAEGQAASVANYPANQPPYAFTPNGMTPEQAAFLAQQSGYAMPQVVGINNGFIPPMQLHHQGLLARIFTPNQHAAEKQQLRMMMQGNGYAVQDFSQGYTPQAPQFGSLPLGINNLSVQGRDVGFNYNQFGGMGARFRL